jgi:hypothetical protein
MRKKTAFGLGLAVLAMMIFLLLPLHYLLGVSDIGYISFSYLFASCVYNASMAEECAWSLPISMFLIIIAMAGALIAAWPKIRMKKTVLAPTAASPAIKEENPSEFLNSVLKHMSYERSQQADKEKIKEEEHEK